MSIRSFLWNTPKPGLYHKKKSIDSVVPPCVSAPEPAPTPSLSRAAFTALFFVLFLYSVSGVSGKYTEQGAQESTPSYFETEQPSVVVETRQTNQGSPVRLRIPSIHVDTAVEYVGLTSEGAMGVPNNTINVGWYGLGPRPGDKGSAVIAGHLNGKKGEAGVFTHLNQLKEGDTLYVEDSDGISTAFVVRESRSYEPGYASDVFRQSDDAHLNLITCSGEWDRAKGSYSKRLVVFADIAPKSLSLK